MDGEKLGEKNMIGIIDLTRVNQARQGHDKEVD
jgi:hypothetical protein